MEKYLSLIEKVEFLNSFTSEDVLNCLKNGKFKVRKYGKDSLIHIDGERCKSLDVILEGSVVVDRIDISGDIFTITEFNRGDFIGGNLVFSKNPYYPMTVSTQAITTILEIDKEVLMELFEKSSFFLEIYLEYISDHSLILGNKIKNYANKSIREKIMDYLNLEKKKQKTKTIKLTASKKALAEKMGVQRTSLSRELAKMRDDGLIKFDCDYIEILY